MRTKEHACLLKPGLFWRIKTHNLLFPLFSECWELTTFNEANAINLCNERGSHSPRNSCLCLILWSPICHIIFIISEGHCSMGSFSSLPLFFYLPILVLYILVLFLPPTLGSCLDVESFLSLDMWLWYWRVIFHVLVKPGKIRGQEWQNHL